MEENRNLYITAKLRNPAHPDMEWEGRFRVDQGSTYCQVPWMILEDIGLASKGLRWYRMPDGSLADWQTTTCDLEYGGVVVGITTVMAPLEMEPVIGSTALQSLGYEVDPNNRSLRKLPYINLGSSWPKTVGANGNHETGDETTGTA